jgi:membrane protein implicated in regulation of membrane protease activity
MPDHSSRFPRPSEWTIPAPVRALLWWPPVAFVLVVLAPHAAAEAVALAGAVLAVLGVVGGTVARRWARRRVGTGDTPPLASVEDEAYEQRVA